MWFVGASVLKKLAFEVEGRDDLEIDLTGDLSTKPKFDIKEGIKFKIRIDFMVQVIRDSVSFNKLRRVKLVYV